MKKRVLFTLRRQTGVLSIIATSMFIAFYAAMSAPRTLPVAHTAIALRQSPKVLLKQQSDTPLRLSFARGEAAIPPLTEFEVIVENDSAQAIRAYAIRYEVLSGNSGFGGSELANKMFASSVLQPGQSESVHMGEEILKLDASNEVTIFVDFVEFVDGTTWGPDISKSKERLLGLRAGAREASRYFLQVLKQDGPQALTSLIKEGPVNIVPESSHSSQWQDGFRMGVAAIRARLESAYAKSGLLEIESELGKPFDASEGRR